MHAFHVGKEVVILGVSLYVLGVGKSPEAPIITIHLRFVAASLWSIIRRADV